MRARACDLRPSRIPACQSRKESISIRAGRVLRATRLTLLYGIVTALALMFVGAGPANGDLLPAQRREVAELRELLVQAGNLYKQRKYADSVAVLEQLQRRVAAITRTPDLQRQLAPIDRGVEKARGLLKVEGFSLAPPALAPAEPIETPPPGEPLKSSARLPSASHEQLQSERAETARRNWKLAFPGQPARELETADLLVIGNVSTDELSRVAKLTQGAAIDVRRLLRRQPETPLVKGRLTLFVLDKPFDFAEFTQMVERRALPSGETAYWRLPEADAYVAIQGRSVEESSNKGADERLLRDISRCVTAVVVAQGNEVPAWFAEGVARSLAEKRLRRDSIVRSWSERLGTVVSTADKASDLLPKSINDEVAGLTSLAVVHRLQSNTRGFAQLMKNLNQDHAFPTAFATAYGDTPEKLVASWLDKKSDRR